MLAAAPHNGAAAIFLTQDGPTCLAATGRSAIFGASMTEQIIRMAGPKGDDGLEDYQLEKNANSIDGLPAVTWVRPGGRSEVP